MERVRVEEGEGGLGTTDGNSECAGKSGYEEMPFRLDYAAKFGVELSMFGPNGNYGIRMESPSFDRSECDRQIGLRFSGNDTCSVVEELTVNNCGISNAANVDVGKRDESLRGKKGHWQHPYKLMGRSRSLLSETTSNDQGHMVFNAREGLKRMSSDYHNSDLSSGHLSSRDPEEVSAQLMIGYNKIISSSSLPQEALRRKTLVSPHLAQFFATKVNKGKGVADSEQYMQKKFLASSVEIQNVESDVRLLSSEPSIIDECTSSNIKSSAPRFSNRRIILRNWLKPGRYKLNQNESLVILRKILELVDDAHSRGFVLDKLRPSYFMLEFPNCVKYIGPLVQATDNRRNNSLSRKRQFTDELFDCQHSNQQKLNEEPSSFQTRCEGSENELASDSHFDKSINQKFTDGPTKITSAKRLSSISSSMEEQWYSSPEELSGMGCTYASNIYAVGVLFFELLCCSRTHELLSAAMMNLRNRVLPPTLLSENPKEVGFCLWLLHPNASLRPSVRDVLVSDLLCPPQKLRAVKTTILPLESGPLPSTEVGEAESELLLHFLTTAKEKKESQASILKQQLEFLSTDLQNVEKMNAHKSSLIVSEKGSCIYQNAVHGRGMLPKPSCEPENKSFMTNKQLEDAYFYVRSKMQRTEPSIERPDIDVLNGADRYLQQRQENGGSLDAEMGLFFEGLCKYAAYNKLEERGTLRSGDLLNSANVVCSIAFDRDEDFIATAWVSKKIKIFGFDALLNCSTDIHYPAAEMSNKSMLSCVCWNSYIKNYLASTDYDGTVQMWDVNTSQAFSQYSEHQKRAWSIDFSKVDPRKFATGSDDYLVKIWSINERNSTMTIRNPANICCVQFSPSSSNLVAFGSADYKLYCYDLRYTRIPWCTLADHERTVSHVKFLDSNTVVSASTDNTLKLWDLKKTSPTGVSSNACSLTYKGHTNQKNFVGLSVSDGYIACGSETNEVFTYHKSLPMPITSYKFNSADPVSGRKMSDDHSQFVSSVCWRRKSNMILAANSKGNIKLLQMGRDTT